MVFKRPVTGIERLYLAGKHVFSDVVIQVIIEGEGSVDPEDLKNALARVSRQFPGTALRLYKNNWIGDGELPKVICLKEYPDTGKHLSQFVHMHEGFNPELGHTVEVEYAKKDNRTLLNFRSLHSIMDGYGLDFWIQAVFSAMRHENIPWADSTMNDDAFMKLKRAHIRKEEPFIPRCTGPVCGTDSDSADNFDFDYARLTLKGTVPAVVAKLSIGIKNLLIKNESDRGTILVPVDFRQDIEGDGRESTANLSFPVFLNLEKNQTWSQLLSQLLTKLQEKRYLARSRNNVIYKGLSMNMLARISGNLWNSQIRKGKYLLSAVVSHVGRKNFKNYSIPGFQADSVVFVPCIMPIAPLSLAITESDTKTEIILVKGKTLFSSPGETLEKIITLSGLDHLIMKDVREVPDSDINKIPVVPSKPLEPVIYKNAHLGLHELFEGQVLINSEGTCLIYGEDTLTYLDVNIRANKIAHLLLSRGMKKGDFVCVLMERSFDAIISILAIMKAGGVYVPLDISIPYDRLEYMLTDSKPAFIIIRDSQTVPVSGDLQVLNIDDLAAEIARCSDQNLNMPIVSGDLCYMIYTSGSTGQPKGAMNTHAALTNNYLWMQDTYGLNSDDATLQKTPFNFDASILEIFLALQSGARIVIARPDGHKSTGYLLEEIRKHGVTFIFSVPSVLNIMLDEMGEDEKTTLRLALVGGEEFSMHLYKKLRSRFPDVSVYNLYGPAEAAIEVTTFDCRQEFDGESVPIGKPIANVETFIVDENMNPVEPGTPGELIISGIAIGPGYFGRADLTAEYFIEHPFQKESRYRAYRTGDIVRQLPGGNLVFLGRKDNQIKIGGVRIETGEIEHHLLTIPWVDEAVVVGKKISSNQSDAQITLVAYYSAREVDDYDQNKEIRSILRKKLPGYMVPSVFVKIVRLPLNSSGKVDRLNLPDPAVFITDRVESCDTWSEVEKKLADLWEAVLGFPPNRNSNFFDMGGNSILAITLIEKINKDFQCKLQARILYENPDFADIVNMLQKS